MAALSEERFIVGSSVSGVQGMATRSSPLGSAAGAALASASSVAATSSHLFTPRL